MMNIGVYVAFRIIIFEKKHRILFFFFFFARSHLQLAGYSSLIRVEPRVPALGGQSLIHWTIREIPKQDF